MNFLKIFIASLIFISNTSIFASVDETTVNASNSFTSQYSEDQLEDLLKLRLEYAEFYFNQYNERLFYVFVTRASTLAMKMKNDLGVFLKDSFSIDQINLYIHLSQRYNGYVDLYYCDFAPQPLNKKKAKRNPSKRRKNICNPQENRVPGSGEISCCNGMKDNIDYFLQSFFRFYVENN
ncbi:MAG: hypothetical protein AB8G05_26815 [Oligoflexales bacterium]